MGLFPFSKIKKRLFGTDEEDSSKNQTQSESKASSVASNPLKEIFQNDVVLKQSNQYQTAADVKVDLSQFGVYKTEKKVHNEKFESVRTQRINAVFKVVRPYYDFMLGFDAIIGNPDICLFIEKLMREFIGHFWDMPASLNHHDSKPFGQLNHSLITAIVNAEKVNSYFSFNTHGIDSEKTYKEKPYALLAAFIVGLLHDANKIFHYQLKAKIDDYITVEYNPIRGGILNFNMSFPTKSIVKKYQPHTDFDFSMISFFFHRFVPIETQMAFPPTIYWMMVKQLKVSHEESLLADTIAVQEWATDKKHVGEIKLNVFQYLYWSRLTLHDIEKTPIYRLDDNWYAVHFHSFVRSVSDKTNISIDAAAQLLSECGFLNFFINRKERPVYCLDVLLYLKTNPAKTMKCTLAVVPASFLEPLIQKLYEKLKDAGMAFFSDSNMQDLSGLKIDSVKIAIQHKQAFNCLFEGKPLVSQYIYHDPEYYTKKLDEEAAKKKAEEDQKTNAEKDNSQKTILTSKALQLPLLGNNQDTNATTIVETPINKSTLIEQPSDSEDMSIGNEQPSDSEDVNVEAEDDLSSDSKAVSVIAEDVGEDRPEDDRKGICKFKNIEVEDDQSSDSDDAECIIKDELSSDSEDVITEKTTLINNPDDEDEDEKTQKIIHTYFTEEGEPTKIFAFKLLEIFLTLMNDSDILFNVHSGLVFITRDKKLIFKYKNVLNTCFNEFKKMIPETERINFEESDFGKIIDYWYTFGAIIQIEHKKNYITSMDFNYVIHNASGYNKTEQLFEQSLAQFNVKPDFNSELKPLLLKFVAQYKINCKKIFSK